MFLRCVTFLCCLLLIIECHQPQDEPHYLRVVDFGRADSISDYNKGVGLSGYVYLDFNKDSVIFYALSDLTGSELHTYVGVVSKLTVSDTLQNAINAIKDLSRGLTKQAPVFDGIGYCGIGMYFEYVHGSEVTRLYMQDDLNERLKPFAYYLVDVEERLRSKKAIPNREINRDSIVVKALKDLVFYDSIRAPRPPYVPFNCGKGVKLENLYGTWRSIGDEYNDDRFDYWTIEIDTAGNWIMERVDCNTTRRRYSGKIKTINRKKYTIELESEHGPSTLEILSLTDKCFQFRLKAGKLVWRFNRMQ